MGYCITAFAVDLSLLSQAIGSRNRPLLDTLFDECEGDFEQYDEMAADYHDDEDPTDPLTMRTTLTQMIMGDAYNPQVGFMYGYALEFLCLHFGDRLPNREWSAMPRPSQWIETVDRELDRAGIPLQVGSQLFYRGPPIAIPEIDDWPAIGYLKQTEVEATTLILKTARLDIITDRGILSAIAELRAWLQECSDSKRDLVCFLA